MKKIYLLGLVTLVAVSFIGKFLTEKEPLSNREKYEQFILKNSKQADELSKAQNEGLKSPDQPDMAAFQEYLKTVDPALGYVPKKRSFEAYKHTKQLQQQQSAIRDYEPPIEWESTGANMGGRTRAIMFDPNDSNNKKVWAGGVTGGLWYVNNFTDLDEEWVPIGDFWSNIAISCITYDPNETETFYVGTGEAQTARIIYRESSGLGAGIYKSTDAGENWELLASTDGFQYVTDVVVRDEEGVSVVYAAVASGTYKGVDHESEPSDGIFRSEDGGETWEQVLPLIPGFSNEPYAPADIEIAANGRIFVGTMENLNGIGGATILYSDEGTEGSWTSYEYYNDKIGNESYFNIPARTIIASAPSDPDIIYAQFAAGYVNGFTYYRGRYMAKSEDGGKTWSQMSIPDSDWSTLAWHAFILKVNPENPNIVYTGGLDLWKTGNAGGSWNRVSDWILMYWGGGDEYVHADQHNIQFQPGSSTTAIYSCDGGVFLTTTATAYEPDFIERNQGYNTLQFYSGAISPSPGANKYLGGLQDNGTLLYNNSPLDINDMIDGGDGAFCFWDNNESAVYITSVYYNRYTFYSNNYEVDYVNGESGTFISPADYDYKENILYSNGVEFGGSYKNMLYRVKGIPFSVSDQLVYIGTNSDVAFSHVKYSRFSPNGTSTLFVGTDAGKLYKVTNAQSSPMSVEVGSPDFPTASISCVALGNNENVILVTFSNYGVSSVWLTKDGGETWEEKETNLPDMPVRWAIFHPNNNAQAMLATETGIWATNTLYETGTEWAPANEGMANVRVDMLKLRYADDMVLAATHGRGLLTAKYEIDIYVGTDENELKKAEISIYPNPASDHAMVTFEADESQTAKIIISDLSGKMISTETFTTSTGQVNKRIDISGLSHGIYLMNIHANGIVQSEKLIVN